ncbi:hypothetical protein [Gordonia malaquae]|uniref:hypothetical protein n=1 Tax=Gordonia malaquae TaxID=410332 RepID=UPI003017B390
MTAAFTRRTAAAILTAAVATTGLTACRDTSTDRYYDEQVIVYQDRPGHTTTSTTTRTITKAKPKVRITKNRTTRSNRR